MKKHNSYNQALKVINEDNSTIHDNLIQLKQELMDHGDLDDNLDQKLTLGQKMADKVAKFGGSWWFIIIFSLVILLWVILNACILLVPIDPFPFILLNLALSCLAAMQAPIIMMSQNRQEAKDRIRAELDCRINLVLLQLCLNMDEKIDKLENNPKE